MVQGAMVQIVAIVWGEETNLALVNWETWVIKLLMAAEGQLRLLILEMGVEAWVVTEEMAIQTVK